MYLLLKRTFDFLFSLIALIIYAPVFLIIAIILKIESRGPIFYHQVRVGKDGRQFNLIKFRTMLMETDEKAHQLYIKKLIAGDFGPPILKFEMDPRLTKVGKYLRKLGLDELPQLWNVLKGDLSLIGPRPPLPFEVDHYEEWQKEMLKCKPGIISLWTLKKVESLSFEQWIKADIEYVRHQSLFLDLKILFRSMITLFKGQI